MAPPSPPHDELFLTLAQRSGSIDSLLDSFFEFLHRKTDFYVVTKDPVRKGMGFQPGQAQQRVLAAFGKYPLRDIDEAEPSTGNERPPATEQPQPRRPSGATAASSVAVPPPVRRTDNGKQLPVGNGGSTDKYTWNQTLEDVTINMRIPEGTRSKDIDCQIRPTHLRVAVRNSVHTTVLLDADLPEKIRVDESVWSLESNQTLTLSLEKIKQTWWACAVVGDDEIDTSEVDSTRHIHEYDEATQGAIRKAMFDQHQRQQGLPTTDELEAAKLFSQVRPDSA